MIVKIFAGPLTYDFNKLYSRDEEEYIVGVDHGALLLLQNNMKIDLAIGDFDSVTEEEYKNIEEVAVVTKKFHTRKDYTDLYLAIEDVLEIDYERIVIYGAMGGRFDHSYANFSLLRLGSISIQTEEALMYALKPGTHLIKNKYKYISFFALEDIIDLTIKDFLYEKRNFKLLVDDPLCISNEGEGVVSFSEGLLLVIHQDES
ncbi:MAG: thiamine diphosphokinase [Candidatus Izimaplasma sp.]|nr:thiamine diphosphokinase [Candidatus Izimaplasma bacterium]